MGKHGRGWLVTGAWRKGSKGLELCLVHPTLPSTVDSLLDPMRVDAHPSIQFVAPC
jgi:hypothetical protein